MHSCVLTAVTEVCDSSRGLSFRPNWTEYVKNDQAYYHNESTGKMFVFMHLFECERKKDRQTEVGKWSWCVEATFCREQGQKAVCVKAQAYYDAKSSPQDLSLSLCLS